MLKLRNNRTFLKISLSSCYALPLVKEHTFIYGEYRRNYVYKIGMARKRQRKSEKHDGTLIVGQQSTSTILKPIPYKVDASNFF